MQLIVLIFIGFVSREAPVSSNFSSILCFLSFLSNTYLLLQDIFTNLYSNLPGTSTRKLFCEVTFCCKFRLRSHIAQYHIPYSQYQATTRKRATDFVCYILCMTHWKGMRHLCLHKISLGMHISSVIN